MNSTITFHFHETAFTLRNRKVLKSSIERLLKKHKRSIKSLSFIFCTDKYLLKINQLHLKHDYYTDIITFDLSDEPNLLTGEIYISVDRVRDNAMAAHSLFSAEMLRVIFHGVLHLCGYRDKTVKEKVIMRKAEDKMLKVFCLAAKLVTTKAQRENPTKDTKSK